MGLRLYAAWSSCDQKPCQQFLYRIRYGFLSPNKSMEPSPSRKRQPLPGQGCKLHGFSKTSSLTSPPPVRASS